MPSNPDKVDRIGYEIKVANAAKEAADKAVEDISANLRVLETALMEFIQRPDRLSLQDLIKVRVHIFLTDPERPCLFCTELYDWLYPPPPPTATPDSRFKYMVETDMGSSEIEAVSADAAIHATVVERLRDTQFERGHDYHQAYMRLRNTAAVKQIGASGITVHGPADGQVWLPTGV